LYAQHYGLDLRYRRITDDIAQVIDILRGYIWPERNDRQRADNHDQQQYPDAQNDPDPTRQATAGWFMQRHKPAPYIDHWLKPYHNDREL